MRYNIALSFMFFMILLFSIGCINTPKSHETMNYDILDKNINDASLYFSSRMQVATKLAIINIQSSYTSLSEYINDKLIENLVNINNLTIVDRANLIHIQEELNLQLSGLVSDETAKSVGKLIGADVIIVGIIFETNNYFNLRLRAINVESGIIVGQYNSNIENNQNIQNIITGIINNRNNNLSVVIPTGNIIIHSEVSGIIMLNGVDTGYNIRSNGIMEFKNMQTGTIDIKIKTIAGQNYFSKSMINIQENKTIDVYIEVSSLWGYIKHNSFRPYSLGSVVSIHSFYGDPGTVLIPSTINNQRVIYISGLAGNTVFYPPKSIKKVIIPDSLRIIGFDAFADCDLIEVDIPNGIYMICSNAFSGNLLTKIKIGFDVILGARLYPRDDNWVMDDEYDTSFPNGFDEFYRENESKGGTYSFINGRWNYLTN